MAQFDPGTIVASTKTGTALASDLNQRLAAVNTGHSGTSRPSYAGAGMPWVNTSFTPPHLMLYDGSVDIDLTLLFAARPGTIEQTAEIALPSGYLWCDGSQVSRSTYATLMGAITKVVNSDTDETAVIAVDDDLRNLGLIGAVVEGSGIPSGSVITAISASTITIDQDTTATASDVSLRIFPWGAGNGSTTFDVPDQRGLVAAGRDDMGGSAASRLTSGGSGLDGTVLGVIGGAQTVTLSLSQIPSHNHTASSSGSALSSGDHSHATGGVNNNHFHTYSYPGFALVSVVTDVSGNFLTVTKNNYYVHTGGASASNTGLISGDHGHTAITAGTHTHTLSITTTVNANGGGGAHNNVQPTGIFNFIIKT